MSSGKGAAARTFTGYWVGSILVVVVLTALFAYYSLGRYKHIAEGRFVGSKVCAECHREHFESWSKTRMANSFEVLRAGAKSELKKSAGLDPDADYTHDKNCLPCHTTGYGMTGGFVSVEKTPDLVGVGCESCHGAGGMYVDTIMKKKKDFMTKAANDAGLVYPPTEPRCRTCHNEKSPFVGMEYKFDFKERLGKGVHEHFPLKYKH